ncbi:MAG TPA: CPBP family intramembrane glutamic endopeptidase [Chthoniobacterales bacterium]|nr:CPBP family intramembrane glutamic endopeptidase [Chthoniobacterales bacterium]
MKDAAKLLAYFAATLLFGALSAPPLYWAAQWLMTRGISPFLAEYDFERFFHRALLVGAILFFWPLLRSLRIRNWRGLELQPNAHRWRDVRAGFFIAVVPLLFLAVLLFQLGAYGFRREISLMELGERTVSAMVVPFLEEPLFRGLILGVLMRSSPAWLAALLTSAVFSILHFLKAPEHSSTDVTWTAGFVSIANAFHQFGEPFLLLAGFTTLFLLGYILADARIRTRSLWLPIGLHAGWIFASAAFNKIARREFNALPWLGENLLIGIAPLCIALVSWLMLRAWLYHVQTPET